ncbi:MAG TPA: HD domain-containing phosphohydrolase [Burkholderiaceae bacterium]
MKVINANELIDKERTSTRDPGAGAVHGPNQTRLFATTDHVHLHGRRSAWLASQVGSRLALPPERIRSIAMAALTHDLGKCALPAAVLDKPGPLTRAERILVERHCQIGAGMLLADAPSDTNASTSDAIAAVLSHHEWWNGRGYPFGLSGHAIPRCARIVAVADVFDALCSARPYKSAWTVPAAVDHIVSLRGAQFEPDCVDALVEVARDLPASWQAIANSGPIFAVPDVIWPGADRRRQSPAHCPTA